MDHSEGLYYEGQKVELMDGSERAVIVGRRNGRYLLELEGMEGCPVEYAASQFCPVDAEDDRKLGSANPARRKKADRVVHISSAPKNKAQYDLHFEKIPGHEHVARGGELAAQMNYFRQVMNSSLRHKGLQLTFLHGYGEGVLRDEVRKALGEDRRYRDACTVTFNSPDKTSVTIK